MIIFILIPLGGSFLELSNDGPVYPPKGSGPFFKYSISPGYSEPDQLQGTTIPNPEPESEPDQLTPGKNNYIF